MSAVVDHQTSLVLEQQRLALVGAHAMIDHLTARMEQQRRMFAPRIAAMEDMGWMALRVEWSWPPSR